MVKITHFFVLIVLVSVAAGLCLNFTILFRTSRALTYLLWAKNWNFMVLAGAATSCTVLLAYRFRRLISCWCRAAAIVFTSKCAASQYFMYGLIGFKNGATKRWIKRINRTWKIITTKHYKSWLNSCTLLLFAWYTIIYNCWLALLFIYLFKKKIMPC